MIWLYALTAAYLFCLWTSIVAFVVDDGRPGRATWCLNIIVFIGLLPALFVLLPIAIWRGETTWGRALSNSGRNLRDGR